MKPIPSLQDTFCKRLKEARLAKGFSQKGLGMAAGIDAFSASARINRYELGKHKADWVAIQNLANALGIDPTYFFARDDELAEIILRFKG